MAPAEAAPHDELVIRIARPDEVRAAAARAVPPGVGGWRLREALVELLQNAIEHGNLGFSGRDKQQLMAEGVWEAALQARLAAPFYAARVVVLCRERCANGWRFEIRDAGSGFDPQVCTGPESSHETRPCGRGLRIAEALLGTPILALPGGGGGVSFEIRAPGADGAEARRGLATKAGRLA